MMSRLYTQGDLRCLVFYTSAFVRWSIAFDQGIRGVGKGSAHRSHSQLECNEGGSICEGGSTIYSA
jgi:hypothetical protein